MADRCSDLFLAGIVVMAGAPTWLGVGLAVLTLLLEGTRSTAQAAGMTGPGTVTVWERPSRVILAVIASVWAAAAWWWGLSDDATRTWLTVIAGIGVLLAATGLIQLLVAVARQTRDRPA